MLLHETADLAQFTTVEAVVLRQRVTISAYFGAIVFRLSSRSFDAALTQELYPVVLKSPYSGGSSV